MKRSHDYLIITNNPLVKQCLSGDYSVSFYPDETYRDILIRVRDLVYAGHRLYTHPLAGSVKPNETPFRSVLIGAEPHELDESAVVIIASAVEAFDKFTPRNRHLTEQVLEDFQLIDYTLLCGALDFDAAAGLSKIK